jgi:hypothetical protein
VHLLPSLASVFAGDTINISTGLGLDDLLLALRMVGDLLTHVLRSGPDYGSEEGDDVSLEAMMIDPTFTFFQTQMLPKYSALLTGPDPLPQLALKILFTVLDHNVQFVSKVEDARLVRKIVSCLTSKNIHSGEQECSVHAARVLWCVLCWDQTSILKIHTYDVVHRLRKSTIVAHRTSASSCYEPLLACTESILLHGCDMVRSSAEGLSKGRQNGGGTSSNSITRPIEKLLKLKDVREYIRELLHLEYVEVLTSLISNPKGESAVACEEVQLRASQCLLLMGQFLGSEMYEILLSSSECLNNICDGLIGRYNTVGTGNNSSNSGQERRTSRYDRNSININNNNKPHDISDRRIQTSMRTLQTFVFACDSSSNFCTMISKNKRLINVLEKCERSNDKRDLRTAVSGSWAGLSVSALAHVLNQKLRNVK